MKWISVKDRLPEGRRTITCLHLSESVLMANNCNIYIGYYNKEDGFWHTGVLTEEEGWIDKITHWMPLPENPHNYISLEDLTKELKL